jgi:hypothetical protein
LFLQPGLFGHIKGDIAMGEMKHGPPQTKKSLYFLNIDLANSPGTGTTTAVGAPAS